jgi:copper transport protein
VLRVLVVRGRPRLWSYLLVAAALVAWPAASASAHATLVSTLPQAGYTTSTSPTELRLDFDETVTIGRAPVQLLAPDGAGVALGPPHLEAAGHALRVPVRSSVGAGRVQVRWQVTAADGDAVEGSYSFGVGSDRDQGLVAWQRSGSAARNLWLVAALRWLLFAAFFAAWGELVLDRLVRGTGDGRWLRHGGLLGASASLGQLALLAGASGGGLGWAAAVRSGPGRGLLAEAGLLLLVAGTGWWRPGSAGSRRSAAALLIGAAVADAAHSHLRVRWGIVGVGLGTAHLLAAATWLGGLVHLVGRLRGMRARGQGWAVLFVRWGHVALPALAVVVSTGTVASLAQIPTWSALVRTGYGLSLLVKIACVAAAMLCAWRVRRIVSRGHVIMRAEAGLLAVTLAAAALLVSLAPPVSRAGALPPAVPVGPVVHLGGLAGQVTLSADLSAGLLVVRARVPEGPWPRRSTVSVDLAEGPGVRRSPIGLRDCGPGCYTAPRAWVPGSLQLRLRASAPGWSGGVLRLDASWPPSDGSGALAQLRRTMGQVPKVTLVESATSDGRQQPAFPQTLTFTGAQLLDVLPYGRGTSPGLGDAALLPGPTLGSTELLLGFPAEGISTRLTLRADGLPVTEQLVTPNHLILRTFRYPPP